jgi:hypothetical protein
LIEAAVLLATDELLRAQLRIAARSAVEAQSWETVIAGFESDLLGVVHARAPAAPPDRSAAALPQQS